MTDKPFIELLSSPDVKTFNVPIFQRPYSWGVDQISQFTEDLQSSIEANHKHFFGLLVYVKNLNDEGVIDIIDGQQRLTTSLITLSIVRDLLEDLKVNIQWDEQDEEKLTEVIFKIKGVLNPNGEVKLVTENESNYENQFLSIIQTSILGFDSDKNPRKEYDEQESGSKNRFEAKKNALYNFGDRRKTRYKTSFKNYIKIREFLWGNLEGKSSGAKKNYLTDVTNTILNNFRVIPFEVESYERAFEYFEVLNDRGLDVSALDLIKNQCLKTTDITPEQRDEIFQAWSEVFSNTLDHTHNLIRFVRYSFMAWGGHITNKDIYKSYKDLLGPKEFVAVHNFLTGRLLDDANVFKSINSNESDYIPKIHNAIQLLISTKTVQWQTIAIKVLQPFDKGISESAQVINTVVELFEELHEIMFTLNYVEKIANDLEKRLPAIAKEIEVSTVVDEMIETWQKAINSLRQLKYELNLNFQEIDFNDRESLSKSLKKNNALGLMFLFYLTYKETGNTEKLSVHTLEHVVPQKLREETWPDFYGLSQEERDMLIYSFGNFLLSFSTDNSSYGNKSFEEKKGLYESDNLKDVISESEETYLYRVSEWTPKLISNREQHLIQKFKEITS